MTLQRRPLSDISAKNDITAMSATPTGPRKSGRATKAPEKFVPDASGRVESATTSTKRKRAAAQDLDDASNDEQEEGDHAEDKDEGEGEDEDEDEDGEDEQGSATETAAPKSKRRKSKPAVKKHVAKRAKVNGDVDVDHHARTPVSRRSKKPRKVAMADEDAGGLYGEVFTSGKPLTVVAESWVEQFRENAPSALTDFINLMLKASGSPSMITPDDIDDPENIPNKVQDLQDEYQALPITDYPLIAKGKGAASFREALTDFVRATVVVLHDTRVMYESQDIIENITHWASSLSTSTSRPFRHTVTLISLTITSAICGVLQTFADTTGKNQRLLDGASTKKSNKGRQVKLQERVAENDAASTYLKERLTDIYEAVYMHRYRDIDPKIRVECVRSMAEWICVLPSYWMESSYLRYLGWMLTDTSALVRQEVIEQLANIMSRDFNVSPMRHFLERFRHRVIEIACRDSDPSVRATAIELCHKVRAAGLLEPDDIDVIGRLIFDSDLKVRQSVVDFFVENVTDAFEAKVEELGGDEALEAAFEDEEDNDLPKPAWIKVKCLAEILLTYDTEQDEEEPNQIEGGIDYLVLPQSTDSRFTLATRVLFDELAEVRDWHMLTGYLLYDHTATAADETQESLRNAFAPNEHEEAVLLEVLNAAVISELTSADKADKARKKETKSEAAALRESTARHLADVIPKLLRKYGAKPRTAAIVLQLEHALNLDVFQDLRQESSAYGELLDQISAQFRSHGDATVLRSASAALLRAKEFEELEEVTESKVHSLWDDTIEFLRDMEKSHEIAERGTLVPKQLGELANNVTRMAHLASISDCVEVLEGADEPSTTSILVEVVARGRFSESDDAIDSLEDEATLAAAQTLLFYFMWKVRLLTAALTSDRKITQEEVTDLHDNKHAFALNLISAFSSRASLDQVRVQGAGILLDLHILFRSLQQTASDKPQATRELLSDLDEPISSEVQAEILSIFNAAERVYLKKARKSQAAKLVEKQMAELDVDDVDDEEPLSESEYEETVGAWTMERQAEALRTEQQLCEVTSKIILGILAGVLHDGDGKMKRRIQRNRKHLGPNFRAVLAYLDDKKSDRGRNSKKNPSRGAGPGDDARAKFDGRAPAVKGRKVLSEAVVVEDDDDESDENPFEDMEPEEGTHDDLRRRGLLEDGEEENEEEDDAGPAMEKAGDRDPGDDEDMEEGE